MLVLLLIEYNVFYHNFGFIAVVTLMLYVRCSQHLHGNIGGRDIADCCGHVQVVDSVHTHNVKTLRKTIYMIEYIKRLFCL